MNQKQIILVTGATGARGGSVANALLHNKQFDVRILTRNPWSAKATALRNAGAEVVQGDLNEIKSLQEALAGCYGVFGAIPFRGRTAQAGNCAATRPAPRGSGLRVCWRCSACTFPTNWYI